MNNSLGLSMLSSVLVLIGVFASGAAVSTGVNTEPSNTSIEINGESLTVEARDAPLNEVVQKIGALAGFKVIVADDSIEFPLISASFDNISVLEAVERLVGDTNRVIFYEPTMNGVTQRVISQVWLVGSQGTLNDDAQVEERDNDLAGNLDHAEVKLLNDAVLRLSNEAASSAENEKGEVLTKLVRVLEGAEQPIMRARAVIALGNLHDHRAVPALEAALLDEHSSVRLQSIGALGQIGGERATLALGNILLYGSADSNERVKAAQALWKQDTATARRYLRNGANDSDEQVRLASSKAPTSPKAHIVMDQLDPEESQKP